ncbi:MAG: FlxA-like family protein [Patescibacteria group bacterium]
MRNKIILSLLLICALSMPFFTKAVTVDELKQQIANLQAQINQLIAQLAQQGDSPTTAWCHNFNTNLGVGSTGSEVAYLQTVLEKEGLYQPQGKFSFDKNIASAIAKLQEKYASEILAPSGLKRGTGFVGKSTRAKLNKLYGCGIVALKPIAATTTPAAATTTATATITIPVSNICTQEAKQCPDGSYVSPTGPNCAFAECPVVSPPTTPLENFTYNLQKGWNAISLPIQPADSSLKSFLGQLSSAVNYSFGAYDSVDKKHKTVAVKSSTENYINDLSLDINQNYMLYVDQPVSINIQGSLINLSTADWVKSIRENAYKYLAGDKKNMFLAGFPFLNSITPKAINDIVAQTAPYSSLGWFEYDGGWKIVYWPLSTTTGKISNSLEQGKGYLAVEVIDCQKKYGAGYFCGNSADLANKCNGKGTSYVVSDTNPAAFCGPNVTSLNDNQYYCLKCDDGFNFVGLHPSAVNQPTAIGKALRTAFLDGNKIYFGYGDYGANTGPIDIVPFDVKTLKFLESEYTANTEAIYIYRSLPDGKLYVPHIDPRGGGAEPDFSVKENGVWTSKSPVGMVHTYDIVSFQNKIYLIGSKNLPDIYPDNDWAVIYELSDDGNSAKISLSVLAIASSTDSSRFYFGGELNGKLYVQAADFKGGRQPVSKVFDGLNWTDGPQMIPVGGGGFNAQNFAGHLVYMSSEGDAVLYTFDGNITKNILKHFKFFHIYENELYAIECPQGGAFCNLQKTSDLINWKLITNSVPNSASSFVIYNGAIFIGTSDAKVYKSNFLVLR